MVTRLALFSNYHYVSPEIMINSIVFRKKTYVHTTHALTVINNMQI